MKIRNVSNTDISDITAIYNHYIENTCITFEEEPVTSNEMLKRIETISKAYPFLVAELDNTLIGYAYATSWRIRSAYRFSSEITIYLDHKMKGKGLGSQLFSALIEKLKETDLHVLVGGIALPNEASIALHEKFGFEKVAQFSKIGYKFNQWIDVGYWELKLK